MRTASAREKRKNDRLRKTSESNVGRCAEGKKSYLLGKSIKYPSAVFVTFGGEDGTAIGFYAIPDSVFLLDAAAYMKAIDQRDFLKMDTLIKEEDKAQTAYATTRLREIHGNTVREIVSEDNNVAVFINMAKAAEYLKTKSEIFYAVIDSKTQVFFTADFPGSEFPFDGAILPVRIN